MNYEVIDREGLGGKLTIGEGTKIARRVSIDISADVTIGKNCMISEDVLILTHSHDVYDFMNWSAIRPCPLEIGDNVFIGIRSIIGEKVRIIGKNSFIGAGSIVTKEVRPNCIIAGIPAELIRFKHERQG